MLSPRLAPPATTLLAAALCSLATTQEPTPIATPPQSTPSVRPLTAPPRQARVFVERDQDAVWARGNDWKARFHAAGFTFVPFLGSHVPRSFPLQLELQGATVGNEPVPLDAAPRIDVNGHRVEITRGPLVEAYELRPEHVEQLFVVQRPLGSGALVVELRIDTELAASADGTGGHVFANEFGGVRYGRALAFDAARRQVAVASERVGDRLRLTVPAEFVAGARFPLTIDPLVTAFTLGIGHPSTAANFAPDCAYVGTYEGVYAAVYEEVYSGTDHDIYLQPYDRNNNWLPGFYVDFTTSYWSTPKIASHRAASQFLVVASRGHPTTAMTIWARLVGYASNNGTAVLTAGPQFAVNTWGSAKNPDVGGDPNAGLLPGAYCVTWEGQINGELYYNLVTTDGVLLGVNGFWLDAGPEFVSNPAISKSCGVGPPASRQWIIVWQKRYSSTDEDIYGTVIDINGNVQVLQFLIDYSGLSDTVPEVSSPADLSAGLERYVVTYQRAMPPASGMPAHADIVGQLMAGTTTLSGPIDLGALMYLTPFAHQLKPSVDTDGTRFMIGWSEEWPGINELIMLLATVHVYGNTLAVTSFPEGANGTGDDLNVQITSERSGGTSSSRYMAVWDIWATVGSVSAGAFYFGHTHLSPSSYFHHFLPGCGGLVLAESGLPALAHTVSYGLAGVQGIPALLFGTGVPAIPICASCNLGVAPSSMLVVPGPSLVLHIPADTGLIAQQFTLQGVDLLAPGGCTAPLPLTLSNAITTTIL